MLKSRSNKTLSVGVELPECPICLKTMSAPILQCQTGHSICHSCTKNLCPAVCPICRQPMTNMRNFQLEDVIFKAKVPCPHKSLGCAVTNAMAEVEEHAKDCKFRVTKCPLSFVFGKCSWSGKLKDLAEHFKTSHSENYMDNLVSEKNVDNFSTSKDDRYVYLTRFAKRLFLITIKIDTFEKMVYWVVQYIGSEESAQLYTYEILVISKQDHKRRVKFSDICYSDSDDVNETFRKSNCGVTPIHMLNNFVKNDQITFRVSLKKTEQILKDNISSKEDNKNKPQSDTNSEHPTQNQMKDYSSSPNSVSNTQSRFKSDSSTPHLKVTHDQPKEKNNLLSVEPNPQKLSKTTEPSNVNVQNQLKNKCPESTSTSNVAQQQVSIQNLKPENVRTVTELRSLLINSLASLSLNASKCHQTDGKQNQRTESSLDLNKMSGMQNNHSEYKNMSTAKDQLKSKDDKDKRNVQDPEPKSGINVKTQISTESSKLINVANVSKEINIEKNKPSSGSAYVNKSQETESISSKADSTLTYLVTVPKGSEVDNSHHQVTNNSLHLQKASNVQNLVIHPENNKTLNARNQSGNNQFELKKPSSGFESNIKIRIESKKSNQKEEMGPNVQNQIIYKTTGPEIVLKNQNAGTLTANIPSTHFKFSDVKQEVIDWVPATTATAPSLMGKAFIAGKEGWDGSPLLIVRSHYNGELVPGKLAIKHRAAYIPFGGKEISIVNFEVLCVPSNAVQWLPSNDGQIPPSAIIGGKTRAAEPLYIGRVSHRGSQTPGKIHPSHGCCYISFGGTEISYKNYYILCKVSN